MIIIVHTQQSNWEYQFGKIIASRSLICLSLFAEENFKIIFQFLDSNKTMVDDDIQASFSSYKSEFPRHFLI
jgi:hypothetical protein